MPLTFAYGSNMNPRQMAERCPSATFVCVAELPGRRLDFTRKSERRGCGVADAVVDDGSRVMGVVFEISDADLFRLDASEGYRVKRMKNSYIREECVVLEAGDKPNGKKMHLLCWTYFGEPQENPPLPNQEYKDLIVSGAKAWGLPAEYVKQLEGIETVE